MKRLVWIAFLLFLIVALTGLVAVQGFALAQSDAKSTATALQISAKERLNVFDKAWAKVNQIFFDPRFNGVNWVQMKEKYRHLAEGAADKTQLTAVLQNMLSELHASHMSIRNDVPTPTYGIGATYVLVDGKWVVTWIAPGSPAQRAGLERGWILTSAELDCLPQSKQLNMQFLDLREQVRRVDVSCATYTPSSAPTDNFRALEKGAVYLRLTSFTPSLEQWLDGQIESHKSASTIVLDLRGNSGGGTDTQLKVFDLFFREKTVVGKFRFRNGKEYILRTGGNKSAYQGRVIVLTDRYTQSAAEVFAHAIQESGRGVIVGERSRGGVLLGNHFKLPNGFDLHVAVADYHSAKGIRLEGRGVLPDVAVELTAKDLREGRDAVLERVNQFVQTP